MLHTQIERVHETMSLVHTYTGCRYMPNEIINERSHNTRLQATTADEAEGAGGDKETNTSLRNQCSPPVKSI